MSPEHMEIGRTYRFDYISHTGKHCCVLGKFIRTEIEPGVMWFWFHEEGVGDIPYDYEALNDIREVVLE